MTRDRNIAYFDGEKAKPTTNALKRQIRKAMWLLREFEGYGTGDCNRKLIDCGTKLNCAFNDIRDMEAEFK